MTSQTGFVPLPNTAPAVESDKFDEALPIMPKFEPTKTNVDPKAAERTIATSQKDGILSFRVSPRKPTAPSGTTAR